MSRLVPVAVLVAVGALAAPAIAQLELSPDSYVFFLQDTADARYYIRAFNSQGHLYAEVPLNVGRLPTYTGFASVGNRVFATTYPDAGQLLVEFDGTTGDVVASYDINEPELIIAIDSDQTNIYLNGFNTWTGEMTPFGEYLGGIPKPPSFGGGGAMAVHEGSFYYYDENNDEIVEADRDGNVLDVVEMGSSQIIPDCLDYDPSTDEFLLSGHGWVKRYDRQGLLVSELTLTGFGASFHIGFEFHPSPIPAPGPASAVLLAPLWLGRRARRG